jgi:histidyl-tRNA synthetase
MKIVLHIAGVLLIAAVSNLSSARGLSYYCGRCVVHCWEQGTTDEYYFIFPNECCDRAQLCGGGAEWYPDMCRPGSIATAC